MRAAAQRVLSFLSDVDCFPRSEMVPSLSSLVRCFQAPRRLRAAQQSCQDMTCHLLTTSQLRSSGHASCRPHPPYYDPHRRRLARQGPDCKVTITMSASSIGHCAAADLLSSHRIMVRRRVQDLSACQHHTHARTARGTGHILVGEVQCSCECQICALFHSDPLPRLERRKQ